MACVIWVVVIIVNVVVICIHGDKVQTSLWLDRDVKRLIEDEGLNLSQWVNRNVLISLSVERECDVLERIKEHEGSIKVLRSRLEVLRSRKREGSLEDFAKKQALEEMREYFLPLARRGASREEKLRWIMVPKKIGRCKVLGKSVDEMLDELDAWYDGREKS